MKCVDSLTLDPSQTRCKMWRESVSYQIPLWYLPSGLELPEPTWRSLNRLRTQVSRARKICPGGDLRRVDCLCGATQTTSHFASCRTCPDIYTREDLMTATDNTVKLPRSGLLKYKNTDTKTTLESLRGRNKVK